MDATLTTKGAWPKSDLAQFSVMRAEVRCTPVQTEPEVKSAIASFQSGLNDWRMEDLDLSQLSSKIRSWMAYWWEMFSANSEGTLCQPCFIGFEPRAFVVLGRYKAERNRTGLTHEISINPGNFCRFSEKQVAAVVVHFVLHSFIEQTEGQCEYQYHSALFRSVAKNIGIQAHERGCSSEIYDDPASPFLVWARSLGLADVPLIGYDPKKRQKRLPWVCECGTTVYIASGVRADLFCGKCRTRLTPKAKKEATS